MRSYSSLNNGLVAHYPLDGNGNDLSPYSNHGIIDASPTFDRKDMSNKSLYFDSGYFQSQNIPINLKKEYTFSFWIKMEFYDNGMAIMELAKPNDFDSDIPCNLNPQIWQYENKMYLTTSSDINNQFYIMSLENTGVKFVEKQNWKHVLWTVKNGTTTLYVDGVFKESKIMPWPNLEKVNLTLGNAVNTCDGDFGKTNYHNQPSKVNIDEVRIYKRVLNLSEIKQLSSY